MEWTTDKPTQPGWYWYRPQKQSRFHPPFDAVVHVNFCSQDAPMVISGNDWRWLYECDGQWAGPLMPPTSRPSEGEG